MSQVVTISNAYLKWLDSTPLSCHNTRVNKGGTSMTFHLRQCCCIFTKQTCWTDGVIYMNAVSWSKHARKESN